MGILDHRKNWQFTLSARPAECVRAFSSVFDGTRKGGPLLTRAKWKLRTTSKGAVAIYEGRGGVIGAVTMMSDRASNEQANAAGSQVSFEVEETADGKTVCRMWLSSAASTFGLTNDARFLRPYMQRVQYSLAELDPNLTVETS